MATDTDDLRLLVEPNFVGLQILTDPLAFIRLRRQRDFQPVVLDYPVRHPDYHPPGRSMVAPEKSSTPAFNPRPDDATWAAATSTGLGASRTGSSGDRASVQVARISMDTKRSFFVVAFDLSVCSRLRSLPEWTSACV